MPGATSTRRCGCALRAARTATTPPKETPAAELDHRERIVGLTATVVVAAGTVTHAAEVEADGRRAELLEGARQRPGHLVVERAAVQGMGMAHDAEGAHRVIRPLAHRGLDERLQCARRSCNRHSLGARRSLHHVRTPQGLP
jgi:hypothetical protein